MWSAGYAIDGTGRSYYVQLFPGPLSSQILPRVVEAR